MTRGAERAGRLSFMAHANRRRPVFFNLLQIQMPVGAWTSITHRVTGVFLALGIPFAVYVLDLSLQGPQGYAQAVAWFDNFALRIAAVALVWSLAYHLLAGTRHLLMDIDMGSFLPAARASAWIVNLAGLALTLLAAAALL